MTPQLTLHFGHRVAMGAEDFLVADSNSEAVAWIDRWPDWPAPALIVYGPPGCGKTHLAQVWRARSRAAVLRARMPGAGDPVVMLGGRPHCVIEGADDGVNELALLHLYNILAEQRGTMLLTAQRPPSRWTLALPDLRSRLTAAPAVAMRSPDDALMAAVLVKLFADRQIQVRQDVVDYLLIHLERSFDAARQSVAAIDQAGLAAQRPITVPLVREVLRGRELPPEDRSDRS